MDPEPGGVLLRGFWGGPKVVECKGGSPGRRLPPAAPYGPTRPEPAASASGQQRSAEAITHGSEWSVDPESAEIGWFRSCCGSRGSAEWGCVCKPINSSAAPRPEPTTQQQRQASTTPNTPPPPFRRPRSRAACSTRVAPRTPVGFCACYIDPPDPTATSAPTRHSVVEPALAPAPSGPP